MHLAHKKKNLDANTLLRLDADKESLDSQMAFEQSVAHVLTSSVQSFQSCGPLSISLTYTK